MMQGYEVEWVSGIRPPREGNEPSFEDAIYSQKIFEFKWLAFKFARKVFKTSPMINYAVVREFTKEPDPYARGLLVTTYGKAWEFSGGRPFEIER